MRIAGKVTRMLRRKSVRCLLIVFLVALLDLSFVVTNDSTDDSDSSVVASTTFVDYQPTFAPVDCPLHHPIIDGADSNKERVCTGFATLGGECMSACLSPANAPLSRDAARLDRRKVRMSGIPMRSDIYPIELVNESVASVLPLGALSPAGFNVFVPVNGRSHKRAERLQCLLWRNDTWNDTSCIKTGLIEGDLGVERSKVQCTCTSSGYIAIFEYNDGHQTITRDGQVRQRLHCPATSNSTEPAIVSGDEVVMLRVQIGLNISLEDLAGNVGLAAAEAFLSHQINRLFCEDKVIKLKRGKGTVARRAIGRDTRRKQWKMNRGYDDNEKSSSNGTQQQRDNWKPRNKNPRNRESMEDSSSRSDNPMRARPSLDGHVPASPSTRVGDSEGGDRARRSPGRQVPSFPSLRRRKRADASNNVTTTAAPLVIASASTAYVTIMEFTISSKLQEDLLQQTVASGTLALLSPDGQLLRIPAQNITVLPAPSSGDNQIRLYLILGSAMGAMVVLIVLFIVIAVCVKCKRKPPIGKTQPAMNLQGEEFPPTYRNLQFADGIARLTESIDGRRNQEQRKVSQNTWPGPGAVNNGFSAPQTVGLHADPQYISAGKRMNYASPKSSSVFEN